uniref:Uncharacterized protein n=1 Tax=Glossina palpalis gambiensis TaxID=67801 RepID=A0A1B0AXF2_9MUSC
MLTLGEVEFALLCDKVIFAYVFELCSNCTTLKKLNIKIGFTSTRSCPPKLQQGPSLRISDVKNPQPFDQTLPVAKAIAQESWLIYFKKFQVTDIADAMILKSLFTHLFNERNVCVATSNRHRSLSNFLPFIGVLLKRSKAANMDSGIDYRKIAQSNKLVCFSKGTNRSHFNSAFYSKPETDTKAQMERMFKILCSQENDVAIARSITHLGRNLKFKSSCGRILNSSIKELCDRILAGNDYLQLVQVFHIHQLTLRMKSPMRRFITLIDTFYDNHVHVVISADVPQNYLILAINRVAWQMINAKMPSQTFSLAKRSYFLSIVSYFVFMKCKARSIGKNGQSPIETSATCLSVFKF